MPASKVFLPLGTLITSIHGELNSMDYAEIHTGPQAEGFIEAIIPEQESCYSVVFPKSGAAIWLTEAEVTDQSQYEIGRVLEDGEVVGLELNDDGHPTDQVVQWDGEAFRTYVSGESLDEFGKHNLREFEAARVGLSIDDLKVAAHQRKLSQYETQIAAAPHRLEREDVATIVAALRYYQKNGQGDPANRDDFTHDTATIGGEIISRDDAGIDDLCDRLQAVDTLIGLIRPTSGS